MIPILFEHDARFYSSHGIGDLIDATACETEMNDEGEYELSLTYPVSGVLFNELTIGRIIKAKANPWQNDQLFRIYGYEKEISGKMTVNAQHISYDLSNIPVKKFKAEKTDKCSDVFTKLRTNMMTITGYEENEQTRFTFSSDLTGTAQTQEGYYELSAPSTVRAAILDGEDSIKGVFGGDLVINNRNLQLLKQAGEDRGVLIEYGTDLIDLNQEENISEMITGVLPYYRYTKANGTDEYGAEEEQIAYASVIVYATDVFPERSYQVHRVTPLDLTEYFPNQAQHTAPSDTDLINKAKEWMRKEPNFGEPEIDMTLNYATLGRDVRLHDAITVRFRKMGIEMKAKVTSFKYDVLNERPVEIHVGSTKKSLFFSLEDASRLKKGLLPPERIKDKSLTADKYATGSVYGGSGGGGGGGGGALAPKGVLEENINDEAVTKDKIGPSAVTVNKIEDGAVHEAKLHDLSVSARAIVKNAVAYAKLGEDVQATFADILAAQAVFSGTIWNDGTIHTNSITCSGSISTSEINNWNIGLRLVATPDGGTIYAICHV